MTYYWNRWYKAKSSIYPRHQRLFKFMDKDKCSDTVSRRSHYLNQAILRRASVFNINCWLIILTPNVFRLRIFLVLVTARSVLLDGDPPVYWWPYDIWKYLKGSARCAQLSMGRSRWQRGPGLQRCFTWTCTATSTSPGQTGGGARPPDPVWGVTEEGRGQRQERRLELKSRISRISRINLVVIHVSFMPRCTLCLHLPCLPLLHISILWDFKTQTIFALTATLECHVPPFTGHWTKQQHRHVPAGEQDIQPTAEGAGGQTDSESRTELGRSPFQVVLGLFVPPVHAFLLAE